MIFIQLYIGIILIKYLIIIWIWIRNLGIVNTFDSCLESNFNVRTKDYPKISKQKTTSEEFSKTIEDGSLDFVYIDGDHQYESCKKDLQLWIPKIKKGGIIAGHDYLAICFLGVVNAVNETFGSPDKTYEDTSWIKFL